LKQYANFKESVFGMCCAIQCFGQIIIHYKYQRKKPMTMLNLTNHSILVRWLIMAFLLVIMGAFSMSGLFVGCSQQDKNTPTGFIDIWKVGNKAIPATVYIEVINQEEVDEPLPVFTADPLFLRYFDVNELQRKFNDELMGQGTGMIIDAQGYVLTNNHVVRGATMIDVRLANGRWCPAKLIGTDPQTDLAVVKILDQVPLPQIIFGDSNNLAVGEPIATVGYMERIRQIPRPKLTPTVFGGMVKAVQPNGIIYCSVCPDFWSTNDGNNFGNSGALLLNRQGEVVGVDVAIVTQAHEIRTIGFAIPSNIAVRLAKQLISSGLEDLN
jgi:S1-C subfamily serine protease